MCGTVFSSIVQLSEHTVQRHVMRGKESGIPNVYSAMRNIRKSSSHGVKRVLVETFLSNLVRNEALNVPEVAVLTKIRFFCCLVLIPTTKINQVPNEHCISTVPFSELDCLDSSICMCHSPRTVQVKDAPRISARTTYCLANQMTHLILCTTNRVVNDADELRPS